MSDSDYELTGGSDDSVENVQGRRRLVFRDKDNFSIGFEFHDSIDKADRKALARDIERYGGIVLDGPDGIDTLLIGPAEDKVLMQLACNSSRDRQRARVHVERAQFVRHCIRSGVFGHSVPRVKPMSGVPPGRGRNPFTEEDFTNLAWYISRLLPDANAGGRQSLNFYKTLVLLGEDGNDITKEKKWALRHTAESWKEHYKNHKAAYDTEIEMLVKKYPPDENRQWPYDRRQTKNARKLTQLWEEEESDREEEPQLGSQSEDNDAQAEAASRKRRRSGNTSISRNTPAKRPRTVPRHEEQESSPRPDASSKGKGKATEPEESDEEHESDQELLASDFEFEFGGDEPGPSGGSQSPERTLVPPARTHPSAGLTDKPPMQQTVVEPAPPTAPLSDVTSARKEAKISAASSGRLMTSTPVRSSQAFLETSSDPVEMSPPPPLQPSRKAYQPPRKAARRIPSAHAPPPSPPYKHTRQQTKRQSVEPQPAAAQTRSRAGGKQKQRAAVVPEEGVTNAEEEQVPKAKHQPVRASSRLRSLEPEDIPLPARQRKPRKKLAEQEPIPETEHEEDGEEPVEPLLGETLAEEQDVADLLAVDLGMPDSANTSTVQQAASERSVSMDTDDAYLARGLALSARRNPDFEVLRQNPMDVLLRIQSSRRHSSIMPGGRTLPTVSRVDFGSERRRPRQSAPSHLHGVLQGTPHTPARRSQRESSAESYPPDGTRAKALQQALNRREKGTPYRPFPGTRAAAAIADSEPE